MDEEGPRLGTERLALGPMGAADAERVAELAGERAVAAMMVNLPHPCPAEAARRWINRQAQQRREGQAEHFGIRLRTGDELIGAVSLRLWKRHARGELGFWLGRAYWGRGYATEACRAVVAYGFETLELHRITGHHFAGNRGSGKVLRKVGMRREGVLREHVWRWGRYRDVVAYGVVRGNEKREMSNAK